MVSLKRFVAVSEKAVQVEEATPPQTESEKILYKCRKLSVGAKVQTAVESQRSSAFVQIREEPGETAPAESEESRQKAARRENRLVGDEMK